MFATALQGAFDTQFEFILTAAVVCVAMGATLVLLRRNLLVSEGINRKAWMVWIAIISGLGVWTTHFVAMIGYRPDAALTYDLPFTALSVGVGIVCVGLPLAFAWNTTVRRRAAFLGALSGLGVAAMHFTGMSALQGCLATYGVAPVVAGVTFGAAGFAVASTRRGDSLSADAGRALAIVTGVCAMHFTAMSGLSVQILAEIPVGIGRPVLSAVAALAALGMCLVATNAAVSGRRLRIERRAAADLVARREQSFVIALQNMSNGLVMADERGRMTAVNDRTFELFDIPKDGLGANAPVRTFFERIAAAQNWDETVMEEKIALHLGGLRNGRNSHSEETLVDGRILLVSSRRVPGEGVIITFDDVTEHRAAQAEIAHLAYHDPLTGLPNRRSFREQVQARLEKGAGLAVLMVDLDHFKTVNDTLGHPVGDALLIRVAERLGLSVAARGRVFRLGGDELVVLLRSDDEIQAAETATAIAASIARPFEIDGHTIAISCSIGIGMSGDGANPSELLQKADLALYRAKERGRNRVETYEAGMMEEARERRQLEADLARALAANEFRLVYQPIFRLPERSIIGFEALIRWDHPRRGPVSPDEFIPISEENGMIVEIGAWVLDEACRQLAEWPEDLHMAVNVSAVQMRQPSIVDLTREALQRHGVRPENLTLELTETAIVRDGDRLSRNIVLLRGMGVKISMDDFGTGYSSLAHLREFELDQIKIDRSFVNVPHDDRGAWAVTHAVTSLAAELSVGTVGEGVETQEQLARLLHAGCTVVQGYFLSRPLDASAAGALLEAQTDPKAEILPALRRA